MAKKITVLPVKAKLITNRLKLRDWLLQAYTRPKDIPGGDNININDKYYQSDMKTGKDLTDSKG
ncbi:MAG: hypothetical protein P4L95_06440 [Rouxiella aceris]|uniref:hypothetical protein n=1 Tax=Rouxiella aceris TaxID=2703884 RepID=UPI0028515F0E|nr:hypothetical protein [Rouxiella aceris]MDR3431533.1 hypothetical protein [Rouxiella aceris]